MAYVDRVIWRTRNTGWFFQLSGLNGAVDGGAINASEREAAGVLSTVATRSACLAGRLVSNGSFNKHSVLLSLSW